MPSILDSTSKNVLDFGVQITYMGDSKVIFVFYLFTPMIISYDSFHPFLCMCQGEHDLRQFILIPNFRGFSFERNCVLRRWKSKALKKIINHKVDQVN